MTGDKTEFEKVTNFGNLYKAYKKSQKGNGSSKSKLKFEAAALDGIHQIKRLLETGKYSVDPYSEFKVYEPKERTIKAGSFKDKIVQHSLCDNVLLPLLGKEFIQTNYAGQIGKGTLYGLDCLKVQMYLAYQKYGYDCWIVKGDISKFFYSINHNILKDMVEYFVSDEDVYWICEKFIDSTDGLGLPLGNQVSQVFALLYLSCFDHFVTGELGVKYYGRYMDDFYLIVESKDYAKDCLENIKSFIGILNLELNGKTQIIPFKNGIKFCGFHTYVTKDGKVIRKLTNEKKRAAKKKYRKMAKLVRENKLSKEKFIRSYESWKNHVSHGNCVKFTYKMDKMVSEIIT
ncbi:MAG: reverse transcriptase domain-containing protein [Megamonas funiformis]|uniref:reverse transcriptase domain-containing protein n=1 Tax=Megamonas funiformis TaxID=437897 RepID=UPI00399051C9